MGSILNQRIKNKLSCRLHDQTNVKKFEGQGQEVARDVLFKGGSAEDGELDHPVINGKASQDKESPHRNEGRIHKSEPEDLDSLRKVLAEGGRLIHHQAVGLALSQVF